MRRLLSNTNERQLEFLELLMDHENWLTVGEAARQLKCSERILRNDINLINEQFYPFQIDTSKKKGIALIYPSSYTVDYIYKVMLHQSIGFQFIEMIFFQENLNALEICEKLYISPSTLNRAVKRAREVFKPLGVIIESQPFRISGNESAIRNFFVHFLLEKYRNGNLPFKNTQLQFLDGFIVQIIQQVQFGQNYPDVKLIRAIILTALIRIKNGHHTNIAYLSNKEDWLFEALTSNHVMKQSFYQNFLVELTIDNAKELFAVFLQKDFLVDVNQLQLKMLENDISFNRNIKNIEHFLSSLSQRLNTPIRNKNKLILELYNIQLLFIGNNYVLFDRKKKFVQNVKREYPAFISMLHEELSKIRFESLPNWNTSAFNEILYMLVIHWTDLLKDLENTLIPVKIGIFCDYDMEYSYFIKDLIEFHFGKHVQVAVFKALNEQQAKIESSEYTIVVTNISEMAFESEHIICIHSVPTLRDWRNIKKIILQSAPSSNYVTTKYVDFEQ